MNLHESVERASLHKDFVPSEHIDPTAGRKKLEWGAGQKYSELPIKPRDIIREGGIRRGISMQCIDGRFNPDGNEVYLRIPGGALGLVADVYSSLAEVWKEDYLKKHEGDLISELQDFFGGRISGHTDENDCETGFCGCGHVKTTVFTDCERADENLRTFLLKISSDPEVFDKHVMSGDHYEKKVIHAGRYNVSSNISGVQAFVYHGEYHQAMIESISERLSSFISRIELNDDDKENTDDNGPHQDLIREALAEISAERLEATVERLAQGFEHIRLEGKSETDLELRRELIKEAA
jgi:hypothetical protein